MRHALPMAHDAATSAISAHPRARAVRLSLTDRCDLACSHCRPAPGRRATYLSIRRRLTPADWETLVRGLVHRGIERVHLTGGEPLVHAKLVDIVARIAEVPGVRDLALTTNGVRLAALAGPLRAAGLRRVNVSVVSLDAARFARVTGGGRLEDVLAGVAAARAAEFEEIKTNTLVLASNGDDDGNEHELVDIARWAWSIGATPRFLELVPVGEGAYGERFVSYATMRARLASLLEPEPGVRAQGRGPARYVHAKDGSGRTIGFVAGVSQSSCDGCDRLRVTSDGQLRPCLATRFAVDVREAIRVRDRRAIQEGFDEAWAHKPDGRIWRGCAEESAARVCMRGTGG